MNDEPTPRNLAERTGKHYCIRCLREVTADEFARNDQVCDRCAAEDYEKDEVGAATDE